MGLIKKNIIYKLMIVILVLIVSISGCGQKAKKPQSPTAEPKKPPEELKKLSQGLEDVISQLGGINEELNKPMEEKLKEEEERKKKEEEQKKKEGQQGQGGGEGSGGGGGAQETFLPEQPKATQEKLLKMWEKTNSSIKDLHTAWNKYRPKAVKDGAKQPAVESFESNINQLAVEGDNKDLESAMEYANNASKYIADFKEAYKSNPPPDIERLKYFAREAAIKAEKQEWPEAKENVQEAKKSWDRAKTKVSKDEMEKMNMLDMSINDYAQVIEKEQKPLIKIKLDIIMNNLKEMEKSFE